MSAKTTLLATFLTVSIMASPVFAHDEINSQSVRKKTNLSLELKKSEVKTWLLQVHDLIVNSSDFKKVQEDSNSKTEFYKFKYAFCIDSEGMPVGFHSLSHNSLTQIDEQMLNVLEKSAPFPPAPNHLPLSMGGMRVELTVRKGYKISLHPEWPNTRLAALTSSAH